MITVIKGHFGKHLSPQQHLDKRATATRQAQRLSGMGHVDLIGSNNRLSQFYLK